jgi:hypothetical protein
LISFHSSKKLEIPSDIKISKAKALEENKNKIENIKIFISLVIILFTFIYQKIYGKYFKSKRDFYKKKSQKAFLRKYSN